MAVYPDHAAAERAVRRLHDEGLAMSDLSIIGRDFQISEEPVGFVDAGACAKAGAGTGAWFGGLFGLMVGAAAVMVPGVGPMVVAGPLAAAVLAGLEGALAGTALGGLAGALRGRTRLAASLELPTRVRFGSHRRPETSASYSARSDRFGSPGPRIK